ncbi:MAG: hypothetical protein JWO03_785 [Bacteroidetes bacterium]|nr:hypothetical protein [Bacteroidota bacterium]
MENHINKLSFTTTKTLQMKKLLTAIILLLCTAGFAQKAGYEFIILKFKMPPVHPLPAGSTYRTNINYKLNYNDAGLGTQYHFCDGAVQVGTNRVCKSIKIPMLSLDAKYLNTDQADYTFEVEMPGLQVEDSTFRKSNDISNHLGKLDFSDWNTDFVMLLDYTMPATLIAKDKQGKVLGTMPIIPAKKYFQAVIHRYYFVNAIYKDYGSPGMPDNYKTDPRLGTEVGFENGKQIAKFMWDNGTQVRKYEEAILANQVFDTVEKILRNAYGTIAFASQIPMGKVKVKKGDATFADLDTALSYVSSGAEDLRKGVGTYEDFTKRLEAAKKIYDEALVKNTERLNDDIKNMLYNNLAFLNLFVGDLKTADKYMDKHTEGMMGGHKSAYGYHRAMIGTRKDTPKLF